MMVSNLGITPWVNWAVLVPRGVVSLASVLALEIFAAPVECGTYVLSSAFYSDIPPSAPEEFRVWFNV